MCGKYPGLLTLNIENNIKPKVELLMQGMGLRQSQLVALLAASPTGVLQCVAACVAVRCSALHCVAVRCSVLQCVAVRDVQGMGLHQ